MWGWCAHSSLMPLWWWATNLPTRSIVSGSHFHGVWVRPEEYRKIGFQSFAVNEKKIQVDRKHALPTLLVAIKAETRVIATDDFYGSGGSRCSLLRRCLFEGVSSSDHCDSAQNSVPAATRCCEAVGKGPQAGNFQHVHVESVLIRGCSARLLQWQTSRSEGFVTVPGPAQCSIEYHDRRWQPAPAAGLISRIGWVSRWPRSEPWDPFSTAARDLWRGGHHLDLATYASWYHPCEASDLIPFNTRKLTSPRRGKDSQIDSSFFVFSVVVHGRFLLMWWFSG